MGAVCGSIWLFDGFSGKELGSAIVAGAVFYGLVAGLALKFAHNRVFVVIFCAVAGGIAGAAWAAIRSTSIIAAVLVGASVGTLIVTGELIGESGPQNGDGQEGKNGRGPHAA